MQKFLGNWSGPFAWIYLLLVLGCQPAQMAAPVAPITASFPVMPTSLPVKATLNPKPQTPNPEPSIIILPPTEPSVAPSSNASTEMKALKIHVTYRGTDSLTLAWNEPFPGAIYDVEINKKRLIKGLSALTYKATGLTSNTLQQIVVRAFDSRQLTQTALAQSNLEIWTLEHGSSGGGSGGGGSGPPVSQPVPVTLPELPLIWGAEPEGQVLIHQSLALGQDGSAYFSLFPNTLQAYDASGVSLWQTALEATPKTSPVLDTQGNLYIGVYPGAVKAYDTQGNSLWSVDMSEDMPVGLAISENAQILYAVSDQGSIYAWSLQDHSLLWQSQMNGRGITAPVIWNGELYAGSSNGSWYALNAFTGEQRWHFQGDGLQQNAYALVDHLLIYLPQSKGLLYALDHRGFQLWVYDAHAKLRGSPIQDSAGNLYFVTDDNMLSAISSSGRLLWKQPLGEAAVESSPVLDQSGHIYVAAFNHLLTFDSEGQVRAKVALNEDITSALTLDSQGRVYVLGVSGRIRIYQGLGGGMPTVGWPKAFHDGLNQGFRSEGE